MPPYHYELTRLKASDETRKIARTLYLKASELTKPGSGRSLGQGHNSLLAVCAFLASKRLGNGEITRDQACAVACVDPKTFDSTVATVESVLPLSRSSSNLNQTKITYRSLLKQFVAREDAFVPMAEVEESLKTCELWADGTPIDPESSTMQCAIFYWVCTFVLRVTVPDPSHFRQMLKVSPRTWSASQRVLENHCSHMLGDLIRKADIAQSAIATRSRVRTGSTRGTPYTPSRLGRDLSTHTPKARRINAAAHPLTPLNSPRVDAEESENEASNGTIVVRSSRLSRKQLHCSAWDLQKPTTTTVGDEPLTPSPSVQRRPPVGHVAFDDTPMTSTGMSDTSSPNSHSRTMVRARLRVPLAAKGLSYPIQEGEEMPRRRRRNLRAAFLNPSVYGWKPAAHTAKRLERARKWETLMIDKYGDPLDAW